MVEDAAVLLTGKVRPREQDEGDPPIFLDGVVPLDGLSESGQLAVQIELPIGADLEGESFAAAKEGSAAHPGVAPVELRLGSDTGITAPRFRSRSLKASADTDTLEALAEVFGKSRVRLVRLGGDSGL